MRKIALKYYKEFFEHSQDGILVIVDKKFVICNDTIVSMLGYESKEELLDTHPSDLSPKF